MFFKTIARVRKRTIIELHKTIKTLKCDLQTAKMRYDNCVARSKNTDIIFIKNGKTLEMHFRGDVAFLNGSSRHVGEFINRKMNIVAYSTIFKENG